MRCSNTNCGVEGPGRFCPECGHKMVEKTETVVICSGKLEDGSPCQWKLVPGLKFCTNCGTKVDPALFSLVQKFCSNCNAPLIPGSAFCGQCGHKYGVKKFKTSLIEKDSAVSRQEEICEKNLNAGNEGRKEEGQRAGEESSMNVNTSDDDKKTEQMRETEISSESIFISKSDGTDEETLPQKESNINKVENESPKSVVGSDLKDNKELNKEDQMDVTFIPGNEETSKAENLELEMTNVGVSVVSTEKDQTGNLLLIHSNPNKDLAEQLEQVKIQPLMSGNLNIIENNAEEILDEQSSSSSDSKEDSQYDSDGDEAASSNASGIQEKGNCQTKRYKKQKTNNKKRKKEQEDRRSQLELNSEDTQASNTQNKQVRESLSISVDNNTVVQNTSCLDSESETATTNDNSTRGDTSDHHAISNNASNMETVAGEFVFGGLAELGKKENIDKQESHNEKKIDLFKIEEKEKQWHADQSNIKNDQMKDIEENESRKQETEEICIEDNDDEMGEEIDDNHGNNLQNVGTLSRKQRRKLKKKVKAKALEEKKVKERENLTKSENNNTEQGSVASGGSSNPEKITTVCFHGIISEDWKFNPEQNKLILVMEDQHHKWENMTRVCKIKNKVSDNAYEFEFVLKIPTSRIFQRNVQYKYCIKKVDNSGEEKYPWEHYIKKGSTGMGANRNLTLNERWRDIDVWHQFDGVIEKEPTTLNRLSNMIYSWRKEELVKHAKTCTDYFSTRILQEEDFNYSLSLEQLEMLLTCSKKTYYHDAGLWDYKDNHFKEDIAGRVLDVMIETVAGLQTATDVSNEIRERQVAMALAAILAVKKLDLPLGNLKRWQKVCEHLILRPDPAKKECSELKILENFFHGKREELKGGFLKLARYMSSESKNPSWLFLVPWIHFLFGLYSPYDKPTFDAGHDKKDPTWWGILQLGEQGVKYFRGKTDQWEIPLEETLTMLEPMFEIDYLLPRSFLTVVRLKELSNVIKMGKIPVEICLANLIYQIKVTRPRLYYSNYSRIYWYPDITSDEKVVEESMKALLDYLNSHVDKRDTGSTNIHQDKMRSDFSRQLIIETTKTDRGSPVALSVGIMLHCVTAYDSREDKKTRCQESFAVKTLQPCIDEITKWMDIWSCDWHRNMDMVLKAWNKLFAPDNIKTQPVCDEWNKHITKALTDRLRTKVCNDSGTMSYFVMLYCQKVDSYNVAMQDCMSEAAFKAIEKGYTVDYGNFKDEEIRRFGRLISGLFLKEWNRCVKTEDSVQDIQNFLKWPPFTQFVKIYSRDQDKMRLLSNECVERLVQAVSVIQSCVTSLLSGEITVGNLNQIQINDLCFPELAELVKLEELHTAKFITMAIQVRNKEMEAFHMQSQYMTTLTNLCQHLQNVDRSAVDDTLKKQEHIDSHRVMEFCEPANISKVTDLDTFQPRLCAFLVSQTVLDILPELQSCSDSSIFMSFWMTECQNLEDSFRAIDDVVPQIWTAVKKRWDTQAAKIKTGEIKFRDFEKILGNRYRDDYDKMTTEMKTLGLPDKDICKRIDQLNKYRQLETCVKGAKTVLKFARDYELKGDFSQIRTIANHGENELEMRSFDDDTVMKACDFLKEITPQREACLKMFVCCRPLVQWLKESMKKSGLKELKVFVDLAFMSAGDEPINIARVQCLHSAVTGYAPLIFDLEQNSGYKELLNHCSVVWKELEANAELPDKLKDTNRQLQWLKEIKKAHGSVEVTSLMQAEAINASGVFTVGKSAWRKDAEKVKTEETLITVADIIKLTVPEQEGKSQLRNYTFSQCQDLQSRLMLVAGKADKGSESVERFTMIFDSITRLSNVYIKLCSSGCVLFKDWTARFFCYPKPDRPVCAILEFGHGNGVPQLKGRRSEEEDLKEIIPELAHFMESCLKEWLTHIKDKRKKYFHLNYFTVDQLVILQKQLVKMGPESEPTHLVYPLLSAVKESCTPDDLIEAMAAAKKEIDGDVDMEPKIDGDSGNEEEKYSADTTDLEKRQNFIKELVEAGYEEGLAVRALQYIEAEDVTAGIVWCMDHEDDTASPDMNKHELQNEPTRERVSQKAAFSGWSQSQTDIQTMISTNISGLRKQSEIGSAPLINDLAALWKQFLESISSNIRDYLSLEHLGIILKYLAEKSSVQIARSLPPGFKEGQPNLIICPTGDVLMTTLSMYMMDKSQPLPQSDEILMCTAGTSIDEVDIFWRRAIFDKGRKIHCLVKADILDYDVSEMAERYLEEYLLEVHHDSDLKYRLLVICGSDNEYRSTIVSSLDKFKRQPLPTNISHLREYLAAKLSLHQHTIANIRPAAAVDQQRSTVRVIKSSRAGVGKTLYKQRREGELSGVTRGAVKSDTVSIPLQEKTIDMHYVIQRLLKHTPHPGEMTSCLFHIDVAHEVENGVDYLLFNLLVLGCVMDKTGFVWRKSPTDIYLIETMPLMTQAANRRGADLQYVHPMLSILPDLTCRSPVESLQIYRGVKLADFKDSDQLFDEKQFRSPVFQRTYQYLFRLDQGRQLGDVKPFEPEGTQESCLQTLLRHCGLEDPSWAELHHFVWFLNTQLVDFENNMFVSAAAAEDLPGFSTFVLRFLIQMSRDFSTRSLDMSEESSSLRPETRGLMEHMEIGEGDDDNRAEDELQPYQMRRTWESSPHPYLFFNSDRFSFTFLGFFIDRASGNLIDQQTRTVLETGIMTQNLYDSLVRNHAPVQEDFDSLPRHQKIMKLCNIMGVEMPHDPDDSYELTTDNVKKIMAIYMRFRCDIPVIIMGETGCGKTRLVKFMCALQMPPGVEQTNMILMKVHGGTTSKDIKNKVREAENVAKKNKETYGDHMYTVLFFDEANTTEAIGLIKEIMCDRSIEGKKLKLCENLKMVAACNPYRKHSDELIQKLQQAGLGYHVDAEKTTDRLGRVPMRHLVYRVQPLPQSLLPLVWDFGQLNTQVEDLYIRQMVRRYIREDNLPDIQGLVEVVSAILTASQDYMRNQKDECSFVSLRDVDRVLMVMSWFYQQSQGNRTLFDLMDDTIYGDEDYSSAEEDSEVEEERVVRDDRGDRVDDVTRSLILALGVCYHACLKSRPEYRQHISRFFRVPCQLPGGDDQIKDEIESCQEVFLDHVNLEKNIARNMALKENVFMMVVCIELRIPLFLVGKPGSSKSLAKTIVSDAMQGNASRGEIFKQLKQVQMVSFQCSPLSTPDGIVGTFKQCAQFQKDKDLDTFVSIVVLDEVGLAEDSPRMPLKTLHPLLEDGCQGDEKPEQHKKVAFIGISNWALDPAKMNRGILVQREVPDLDELKNSASGICQTGDNLGTLINPLIEPMAISYLEIFDKASQSKREFYGLRDFYSLVKMVYGFVEKSKKKPTWHEMLHAIKRNFGGLDQVDPVESFKKHLATVVHFETKPKRSDPDCTPAGLVEACLFDTNKMQSESRYLLLLTENYGVLTIIQQQILSRSSDIRPITIFGSSFRSDQEYTQVCRNINKIKVCMETGNTVVLLNLENLYESLYDALNQYYVYFGGERYVDLGLGTHRVKCPVHKMFRLIVVAEKQTVYDKFPTPLINRLEKHFLTINTMLSSEQQNVVEMLEDWAKQFVTQRNVGFMTRGKKSSAKVGDVFIGFHDDTCSAIVLHVWKNHEHIENGRERHTQVFQEAKSVLLWCATPESLVRLDNSELSNEEREHLRRLYDEHQAHDNLMQYLNEKIIKEEYEQLFAQITTHSKLMAGVHKQEVSNASGIQLDRILLLETLSSFDTEQQFTNRIQQHIRSTDKDPSLMVIQCDSGDVNANLIACARYCVMDEFEKMRDELRAPVHVVFIIQLPRGASFTGFQCGIWHSAHIDDLYTQDMNMPTLQDMQGKSIATLFTDAVGEPVAMETDEELPRENFVTEEMEWSETGHTSPRMETFDPKQESGFERAPLQLDDVLIDLQNVDRHGRQGLSGGKFGRHRLNVKGLILSCVQAALSMVKDKVENTSKATDRVALVLNLLHQEQMEGQASFLHGICCLIAKLMKEKESNMQTANMANYWLVSEAASSENINKAGTFRRSCIQTLESKISPILAGIIAYLDTNDNLNILQEQCPWKRELWLAYLNTTDAVNLQTPVKQHDLQEVVVMATGCEGHLFSARMPFSWILIRLINETLSLPHPAVELQEQEETDLAITQTESVVKVLSEHMVGKVLSYVTTEYAVTEAVQEYIHDFVHTMYHAMSEHEHQLVCQSVYFVVNSMVAEATERSLLHVLVNVHIAYQKLAPRLTYFRAMNSVWPDCSRTVVEQKEKSPDHFMFKEQEFTFSALCLLLENLSPKGTDLNNVKGRSHWLNKVHRYRPVVEKVISLYGEDPKLYGAHSFQSVRRAKGLWSRVLVVKLFLEHVCATEKEDKITIRHCMPLWTLLGEETDLKEIRSLMGVEKFLKSCNKQAMKEYFGEEVKCSQCESVLEGPPITLPCKDVLCDQCYDEMVALGENQCHKCQRKFPIEWQPQRQMVKKPAIDKLKDYQKRCNTFFMDVVSQLCFANNTAPSYEVVEKLLGYIFFTTRGKQQRTRDLTIFDTGIDPNPVFRSFLLQLLIRTSEENVIENLEQYLREASGFIKSNSPDQEQQYVELCLLVIQCLEDMFTQEATRADVDKMKYATQALHRAKQTVAVKELTVEKLYGLASARMGLAVVSKVISDIVMNDIDTRHVDRSARKLIEAGQILCEETNIKWTRIFLVKHLCRSYGIDVYQAICRKPAQFLRWISIRDMNREQVVEVSDRYIVCGEHYKTVRESVTKVLLGENVNQLMETVQALHIDGVRLEPMLQMAIHREVTSSYLYPQQQRKLNPQVLETLNTFIQSCSEIKNKQFMQSLIANQLTPKNLIVNEGENLRLQGIQCLIVHFLCVMTYLKGERTLLQPLQAIMTNPQTCANMFLPTMPQDDLEDMKEALLAARQQNPGENPVFYRCPNGHPYVIGNCGRPYVVERCKCGAEIGGQGHKLLPTNTQDTGRDNTLTGHILGRADVRGKGPKPERALTPAYTATVRLLVHLAMYVASGRNAQGVHAMIKPDIEVNIMEDFLWEHIQLDLDDIQRALGRSVDDVFLLMHTVVNTIMIVHNEEDHLNIELSQLSSKRGRQQWETGFADKFLKAVLQNVDNVLKENNHLLVQDERLGADPLLCLLYETEANEERDNSNELQELPRVWRYRTPISLEHLRQEAEAKITQKQHKILQLFLKEDHHLRALRYIPSILRLHRALFQKYQRKLDKAEASQISVAQLRRDEVAGGETQQLLQDFADAWELVRESLKLYLCPTELGGMIVSKEYCSKRITDKTPLSMLLPTIKESGLCSYALLDFLMRKQNDFLDKYLKEAHRKAGSISSVNPKEVTAAHLICYDPQHDILPLVLANCQYSFEMGKGTKIEYDFAGLERQLMDRFMFSKSKIDVGRVLMIDQMVYRTEFTNAEVFRKLVDKIPQETLSAAVKTQICSEIKSLPDLCTSLDNLDIAISFLKSTGGQPEKNLHDFMEQTLQMETSIHSQKAQQTCEFKHAQSLWLILSLQKSKKMIDTNQPTESVFENVIHDFHAELPDEIETSFEAYLKKLSIEKLSQLVEVLHEYIVLVVAVRQSTEDEEYTDTKDNKLGEWFYGYVENMDNPPLDTAILADFPQEIFYKHSVHTWTSAYRMLRGKQTGKYRRY